MTSKAMQETYRWHDDIEVCFYTNLNYSVLHLVSENNTFFTDNRPCCLLKALLCKEVVCDSM